MRANYEKKGYNTAMLDELESQNDEQVSEMAKRVGMLKDVSRALLPPRYQSCGREAQALLTEHE